MAPLEFAYATAASIRRRWYERHPEARRRLRRPVVSVGNLSVGGTGKSPLVGHLAQWLVAEGERPAILSRGYKRRATVDGVVVVSDGSAILADVDHAGDEPLMLARQVPAAVVCVGEDRHLAGVVAERALGATVHLLDDGFQHVQLARDFDILVTSAGEIPNGRVLPGGRLREARDAAARAHFVVVVGADADTARREAWELGIGAFSGARRTLSAAVATEAVVAVAAIGVPEQFVALLGTQGYDVKDTLTWPDHHRYTPDDVARIDAAVKATGARSVVTTAKDAVRFEALAPLPFRLDTVPLRLEIDDWESLTASVRAVLARARHAA